MIRSFADAETERLWETQRSRRLPSTIQATALRRLAQLAAAVILSDLASPPGNRLEALRGSRKGQYSLRINDQWRLVFTWTASGPRDVAIVDYH